MGHTSCYNITCYTVAVLAVLLAIPLRLTLNPAKKFTVKDQCAVVTGASGGIGVVIANELAKAGVSQLALAARSAGKLENVAAELRTNYPELKVLVVPTDVANDAARKNLHKRATEAFGDSCSIILVNNAGVEAFQHFDGPHMAEWIDKTIDINVKGVLHLTREFLPDMMKANRGHVVNIASLAGKIGGPFQNVYTTSKHAVVGFTRSMRNEMKLMGKQVTFSAVCPGFILDTGMAADAMANQDKAGWEALTQLTGTSQPIDSARAVIRAVEYDEPELLVNGYSAIRMLVVMQEIFPRFMEWLPSPKIVDEFHLKLAARYN